MEALGVYLKKVDNCLLSRVPMIGELEWLAEDKILSEEKIQL